MHTEQPVIPSLQNNKKTLPFKVLIKQSVVVATIKEKASTSATITGYIRGGSLGRNTDNALIIKKTKRVGKKTWGELATGGWINLEFFDVTQ